MNEPTDEHVRRRVELLRAARTIAVVGFSTDPTKPSHTAPMELVRRGWDVVPVNPTADRVAGLESYVSLGAVQGPIDLVDVFRPEQEAAELARQAAELDVDTFWLQLGLRSDEARAIAQAAGMAYVEDECAGALAARYDLRPG